MREVRDFADCCQAHGQARRLFGLHFAAVVPDRSVGNRHKAGQSFSYNFHDPVFTEAFWGRNQKRLKRPPKPKKPKGLWKGLNLRRRNLVQKEKVLRKPHQSPLTLRRLARATRAFIHDVSCADPNMLNLLRSPEGAFPLRPSERLGQVL